MGIDDLTQDGLPKEGTCISGGAIDAYVTASTWPSILLNKMYDLFENIGSKQYLRLKEMINDEREGILPFKISYLAGVAAGVAANVATRKGLAYLTKIGLAYLTKSHLIQQASEYEDPAAKVALFLPEIITTIVGTTKSIKDYYTVKKELGM